MLKVKDAQIRLYPLHVMDLKAVKMNDVLNKKWTSIYSSLQVSDEFISVTVDETA